MIFTEHHQSKPDAIKFGKIEGDVMHVSDVPETSKDKNHEGVKSTEERSLTMQSDEVSEKIKIETPSKTSNPVKMKVVEIDESKVVADLPKDDQSDDSLGDLAKELGFSDFGDLDDLDGDDEPPEDEYESEEEDKPNELPSQEIEAIKAVRENTLSKNYNGMNKRFSVPAAGLITKTVSAFKGKRKFNRIFQHEDEIERLKHDLYLKTCELERITLAEQKEEGIKINSAYHLAFMYASPLLRKMGKNLETLMQLDYSKELHGIEKVLSRVKHEVKYKVSVATISNFRSIITDAPIALHFTGHGIENNKQSLGSGYIQYKNKGNILLMEDENCMADYLFENDLKKLVEISNAQREYTFNYEVVFVSSCHSEFAGKIFLSSGARHVICIKQSETISDAASLRFSKVFYDHLFVKKYSVCRAFKIAQDDVRTLYTYSESSKYLLFVKDDDGCKKTHRKHEHKCFPIVKFEAGGLIKENEDPLFDTLPSKELHFEGRQKEMCEVIQLCNKHRLVSILGPPGIGKTGFSRNMCHHLLDRQIFDDGIIFVGLRGCESGESFLTRLSLAIEASAENNGVKFDLIKKQQVMKNNYDKEKSEKSNEDHQEMMIIHITQALHEREVLMLLNHCEDPLEDDDENVVRIIDRLLVDCPGLKIVLTSRKYLNNLEHIQENPYHLGPLTSNAAVKLFLS